MYNLDPNDASGGTGTGTTEVALGWPRWQDGRQLVQFFNVESALLADDFRGGSFDYILANTASLYI